MAKLSDAEKAQRDAEWQASKDAYKQAEGKYGEELGKFNKELGKFEGNLSQMKTSAGALGGEVGKLIGDTKAKANINAGAYPTASIVKRASKNVFEFPVFVSSSVPVDYATAINSLVEQVYASFVQMAISQNPVISAADMKAGTPFKSLKTNVTKYLEYTDPTMMPYAHDACHNVIDTDEGFVEFDMISLDDKSCKIINEALDYQPLSEFDHFFQEAFDAKKQDAKIEKLEDKIDKLEAEEEKINGYGKQRKLVDSETKRLEEIRKQLPGLKRDLKDARDWRVKRGGFEKDTAEFNDRVGQRRDENGTITTRADRAEAREIEQNENARKRNAREQEAHDDKMGRKKNDLGEETTRAQRQEERDEEQHRLDMVKGKADLKAKAPQLMDETKINKLNTMKPLMMTVGVRVMDDRNQISDLVDYVIGVKTHCRMIPAEVLPDFAAYPEKTMNFVARKAKWRAGELKFLDFVFARKEKKQAAYDSRDPKRKWYHRLYTLAHSKGSSKIAREITGSKNSEGLIPNVTMVLTKADVDMIEGTNGIDLLKGSTAARICKELFLIAMIVVDTDAQSIKMLLPDTSTEYEVHSLASVNKQLATLDSASDVSREVSKMMRGR